MEGKGWGGRRGTAFKTPLEDEPQFTLYTTAKCLPKGKVVIQTASVLVPCYTPTWRIVPSCLDQLSDIHGLLGVPFSEGVPLIAVVGRAGRGNPRRSRQRPR